MELAIEGIDKINSLTQRELERKLDIQKKKDDRNQQNADNENLNYFENSFNTKCLEIENSLNDSLNINDKKILPNYFDKISKKILLLQRYVAASHIFLRNYDIKKYQERLELLKIKLKELEDEMLPKKKFGFKNKIKLSNNKTNGFNNSSSKDEIDCIIKPSINILTNAFYGFKNERDQELVMTNEEIFMKDISAENLTNCTVKFFGCSSTLHLNNLRHCKIFSGPVSTSIFVNDCENCVLVIACQQLRLHSSNNLRIYLHVSSRAIMEDCHNIYLAPYNWNYNNIRNDFDKAGLDLSVNNWECVDDFNWLNVDKASPNWGLIQKDMIEKWSD